MTSLISGLLGPSSFSIRQSTNGLIGPSLLAKLCVEKAQIKFRSTLNRHRMEDGSTMIDSRIIQPTTIEITAISPDADTLSVLNGILQDRNNWYLVSMRGISVDFMMADGETIRQTPEMMEANQVSFRLKQLVGKDQSQTTPSQSADSSVIDRGISALKSVQSSIAPTVTSLYNNVANRFGSLL